MKALIGRTPTAQGRVTISDSPLGSGGEGSVYEVLNHDFNSKFLSANELVAKIYHDPSEGDRARKIAAMIKSPPDSTSVAWPIAMLFTEDKMFAGYLMIKLSSKNFRQWSELSNAKDRRATSSQFDVRYALTASRNLAAAIDSIHAAGHRVGDVNESNLFVGSDATVLIVDTDSAQITDPTGKIFPCLVGKPEYTAAELSHGSLRTQTRTIESDVFAYAVAVFQMLTGGSHPTDGLFKGDGEPPSTVDKIRLGVLPGLDPKRARGIQPLARIPVLAIPEVLRKQLVTALAPDPEKRSTLYEIVIAIDEVSSNLKQCSHVKQHWFDTREGNCQWCTHADSGKPDPWGPVSRGLPKSPSNLKQTSLPQVTFEKPQSPILLAKRAAPAVAGQQAATAHAVASGSTALSAAQMHNNNFSQSHPNSQNNTAPQQYNNPANINQNSVNQGAQQGYQQQNYPPQGNQQQASPKLPTKHKGKTILDYADGSRRVRPPISQLLKQNPKVAWSCIKEETPSFAKIWWDISRPVARVAGLVIGLILALILSLSWIVLIPLVEPYLPEASWWSVALKYFSYLSVLTSIVASVMLLSSAVKDILKTKKKLEGLDNVEREAIWKTSIRFLPLPVIYGPILLAGLTVMLFSYLLDVALSGIKR